MNIHSEASAPIDRRRNILDAALAVFAEQGYAATPVPPIAERAGVGVGTIYRYFPDKQSLVNEVFRETKARLGSWLLDGLDLSAEPWPLYCAFWERLTSFAREQPEAFRFLELQDHRPYLDEASRRTERAVLEPIRTAIERFRQAGLVRTGMQGPVIVALVWGAVVGIFKYDDGQYYRLLDSDLDAARDALWRALTATEPPGPPLQGVST
ncbi:MAG: TetR/AcrR family transcriptional regulator [Candidatus Dadabacteria bacterium]|nr:MAG: TetR/AcrR family transcriptional regulator [Candidatus Dadabacteria bacterium]